MKCLEEYKKLTRYWSTSYDIKSNIYIFRIFRLKIKNQSLKKKKINLIRTSRLQYANRLKILALKQTNLLRKSQSTKSFGNLEPISTGTMPL